MTTGPWRCAMSLAIAPCQKRVIGIRRRRVQKPEARAVPCVRLLKVFAVRTDFTSCPWRTASAAARRPCKSAPNLREAVRLARAFKPAHEGSGVASVVKALEGVCRRHDPARGRKPLKDAHPVFVEVLRFIDQNQRKATRHPSSDGFVFQKASRQSARPVKFVQSIGLRLHR